MIQVTMETEPGCPIKDAAARAQRIADQADCTVIFEFNGVECHAVPGGDWMRLVDAQQEEQARKPRVFSKQ